MKKIEEYVAGFIAENFNENICYHNVEHTLEVVEAAEIIGKECGLSEEEMQIVAVAAWFHDSGYYLGYEGHEVTSAEIARRYLVEQKCEQDFISAVTNCILATKVPQKPKNLLEKVICDADLYHLATDKFFEKTELLWQEFSFYDQQMTPSSWLNQSRNFLESHQYHTAYGKKVLYPSLQKNLKLLISKINSESSI